MSRSYANCELCDASLCIDNDDFSDHVCDRIAQAIAYAITAERNRLRLLLLSVASQCGGPVEFALRRIVEGI